MTDDRGHSESPVSDEMAEYLQVFLDETEEQLDDLVETLLVLEREPHRGEELNEAFRLIHSIKGSAGMMGIESIPTLTHHLETRFETFRSGAKTLDSSTMNLVLRCIDFLRECTRRLRAGKSLGSAAELLRELVEHEEAAASSESEATDRSRVAIAASDGGQEQGAASPAPGLLVHAQEATHVTIIFEPDLPLVDLKARLILSRLGALGEIASTLPDASLLETIDTLDRFEVVIVTEHDAESIRGSVDLDGVQRVDLRDARSEAPAPELTDAPPPPPKLETVAGNVSAAEEPVPEVNVARISVVGASEPPVGDGGPSLQNGGTTPTHTIPEAAHSDGPDRTKAKVGETIRVDIDRLDRLMNLAGELVVNRARFVQVTSQVGRSLGTRSTSGRVRDVGEALRKTIEYLEATHGDDAELASCADELRSGLDVLEEQSEIWDGGRTCFVQVGEAIDQLGRIADSLQKSVLATRMVPVAPLFSRFNRVVRDLSKERGKTVRLEIHGEKTELDKRMIDELSDPLVHLVRNSIDHGLEAPEIRRARGKPDIGTIRLEANHSGNNVFISIRDDGAGIDVPRVREKIVERGLLSADLASELSDSEALEYIWHAGFSTASTVTDISGRGVGMDVVRTRITHLSGSVDVESIPEVGTTFTIRLPLTLAIIKSLLIRIGDTIFSLPIDDVREIVSHPAGDIVTVRDRHAIEVRGEFIPLIGIDDVFDWPRAAHLGNGRATRGVVDEPRIAAPEVKAVILHVGGRTIALRVDEPLGSQDIVIKSLADNFVSIRGLSGASILGDGTVCLMLDGGALIDMAIPREGARSEGVGA